MTVEGRNYKDFQQSFIQKALGAIGKATEGYFPSGLEVPISQENPQEQTLPSDATQPETPLPYNYDEPQLPSTYLFNVDTQNPDAPRDNKEQS